MSFFPRSSSNYANAQAERATGLEDQLDDLLDEDELANQEVGRYFSPTQALLAMVTNV